MHVHFQQRAFHALGVINTTQLVYGKPLGNHIDDFIVVLNRHGLGVFHGQLHIRLCDFFIHAGNIICTVIAEGLQMGAAHPDKQAADVFIQFPLYAAQQVGHGGRRLADVGHHPPAHPFAGHAAAGQNL